ncbi:hypothetical protein BOX15_Mlig027302g1 [Macrostomum lignano]|uniref:PLAC8 domain-containing protein n=1 Tax=Macrostomum lignano TaxID=282301 RepID=A0A267DHF4_9PLAT|nr:hypothetical protein BOX15_Mlig027302g3 [Macrostomum lignano]PAA48713.1 hypothetical protein BOX15_Mlig027302g2 [Macrostomum lignano]PAA94116.1 hypothetical protein BOX15_Mlig027302g1 [Macrostomum lignano]
MEPGWRHSIFGCFDDCGICLLSFFCPCYVFAKNSQAVGENCVLCCLCSLCIPCIVGTYVRSRIREVQGIDGSIVNDFCCWFFCSFCALVQEAQEVKQLTVGGSGIERE